MKKKNQKSKKHKFLTKKTRIILKTRFTIFKIIFFFGLIGTPTVSAQNFFRVIGGIPHLPVVDPSSVSAPAAGMLVYSLNDKQPLLYNGSSWETLCSSNINTATAKDYLETATGIPFLPSLSTDPAGTIESGSVYLSKTKNAMMMYNGIAWGAVAKLVGKGTFSQYSGFATDRGLKISKLPVLSSNPAPLGLAAGAVYINRVTKAIRYYDGAIWVDVRCLPVISTVTPTAITNTSALSGAVINNNGGSSVTLQGICWGTTANPDTTLNTKTAHPLFGADTGLFPSVISGLKADTVYHVRAYAVNDSGIVYGDDVMFRTAMAATPSITTTPIDNTFSSISASSGGTISSDGGAPITARGITWSAAGDPMDDPEAISTLDGSGVGSFPSQVTNLLRNTTYYVRAYAINIIGKAYGNLLQFTTPPATAPVLSSPTIKITDITDTSAVSEVTILNNGGETVTERGMSWSTDRVTIVHGPSTVVNTSDIGTFACDITNLVSGTTYFVRAYAKNSLGTTYSSESSFITSSLPTLTTVVPYNYDAASHVDGWFSGYDGTVARSGGDITSNGVSWITKRGLCWSTTPNPTTALATKTEMNVSGSGTGTFYSTLTSLTPATTYYVRAYASNSMGTAYGDEVRFTTPELPELLTTPASLITNTTMSSGGHIAKEGRMPVAQRGVCWSLAGNPSIEGEHTTDGSGDGFFISNLKGLMGNAAYYIRAYAVNAVGISYGAIDVVTTAAAVKASITSSGVADTSGGTVIAGGDITADGGAAVSSRGVLWSLIPNFVPDLSSPNKTVETGGLGKFTSTITGLMPNKTYYVMAYAINSEGVAYGNEVHFKTYSVPSLITTDASSVTSTTAVSGGDIFSDGGATVTSSGIVWNTTGNPTVESSKKKQNGAGIGTFINSLSELMGSTTYYVRAYATNSAGTAYGNEINFTTDAPSLAEIETVEVSKITGNTAQSGGRVSSTGGAMFSACGIVWSTVSGFLPDLTTGQKTIQQGTGNFSSEISGLHPGITYYVRAYASNSAGTVFGNEIAFKTAILASVTTLAPNAVSITSTSATSGGSVINNGGSFIMRNGICWSTTSNPTIADDSIIAGSGSGNFTADLVDLMGSTTYYVRAFATNNAGTAYGDQEIFTTLPPVLAVVTTENATDVKGDTAISGGNIISDGGALVSSRGIVWGTSADFDPAAVGANRTQETGYAKGLFVSNLKDLTPGTTYYIRAYAVSVAGTSYGNVVSFATPGLATITTNTPSFVTNTTAVSGGTISHSGGSNVLDRGVFWSTAADFVPDVLSADRTYNGVGVGSFDSNLKNLIPDTKYYIKAYAVTYAGISYGQQLSFTTYSPTVPAVTTAQATAITGTTANSGGTITDDGGQNTISRGVLWSSQPNFDPAEAGTNKTTQTGNGNGVFSSMITGLNPGTTYYVRAYASNGVGTAYGQEMSFTTQTTATLTTIAISANTGTTAASGGVITSDGGALVLAKGICWSTSPNPNIGLSTKTKDQGLTVFTSKLLSLNPVTTYYVRAYATNSIGTSYGNEISFTTSAVLPSLTTADPVVTSNATATSGGTITFDGGAPITGRGLVWSTEKNFVPETVLLNRTTDGSGTGTFTSELTDLKENTTYYLRAYAVNSAGTAYGNQLTVVTYATSPLLKTNIASLITGTTAISGGQITSDGGAEVIQRGICWSTLQNPTIALATKTSDADSGSGNFTSQLSGLLPNTLYYVRAYAINGIGVSYGMEETFITLTVPTLTATAVAVDIRATTAASGGEITDDGRTPILSRGIVWSIYSNPTTALATKTVDHVTQGIGSFIAHLVGLSPNTTYYVRAYATNSVGVNYGSETVFKTNDVSLPSVTTAAVNAVAAYSANGGGEVLDDGGMPVTVRGVVWNTGSLPTIALPTKIVNGSAGTGLFTNIFSGLAPNTTYYVRAYATNSKGTAYGNEVFFTTLAAVPTLSMVTTSNIKVTSADGTANLVFDGGAAITDLGLIWDTVGTIPVATAGNSLSVGAAGTSISGTFTSLLPSTKYYVWAYGTNQMGTGFSTAPAIFTTPNNITLTTAKPTSILQNTATGGGTISSDGGVPVTARGICWSTAILPTVDLTTKTSNGSGKGSFTSFLTGLTKGTTYYVRAYATNSLGTSYGVQESFTTQDVPALTTAVPTSITTSSAMGGGEISTDGGVAVSARGVCWNTAPNPTIVLTTKTSNGSGTGIFSSTLSGLTLATKYYVRAYATNSVGTAYGNEISFTTLAEVPTLSNVNISNMTSTSTDGNASVTTDGGALVTARGLVWSATNTTPTLDDHTIVDSDSGMGSFTGKLLGLVESPTYYVRAFATNSVGTAYSPVVSSFKICTPFTIIHTAGLNGAPVDKTITYHSVSSSLSGAARCWITQNLGSDRQATAVSDATEPSAGWYWQFNRAQGYHYNGTNRTPATPWIAGINESSDWAAANDPCSLLLGGGWRIPTRTEWTAVDGAPQNWGSSADAYASVLKLHNAGAIDYYSGTLSGRGNSGMYWSSTGSSDYRNYSFGAALSIANGSSVMSYNSTIYKASGFSLRCLRDNIVVSPPSVSNVSLPTTAMTATSADGSATVTLDGGAPVTEKGLVWSSTSALPTLGDNVLPIGQGTGSFTVTLSGLSEGPTYYVRAYATNSVGTAYSPVVSSFKICVPFTIFHTAGLNGAPADKTVTYQSISSSISGAPRCWITQNLGSDRQAASVTDATEGAAGWYFQFNKAQGYKYDGTNRTPATPWIAGINENSDWTAANDPCSQLLGGGWRIPTRTEWTAVDGAPQNWGSSADAYASVLKLHHAGAIDYYNGALSGRGSSGMYWSSTGSYDSSNYSFGAALSIGNGSSVMSYNSSIYKASGYPLRCLRDSIVVSPPSVSNVNVPTDAMTATSAQGSATVTLDGGAPVTAKGFVWSSTNALPTLSDTVLPLGQGTGIFTATLSDLSGGATYYVRAYATNSAGTTYSPVVSSFKICAPFTINHTAGLNGAPADKTVTYHSVSSSISGTARCWITQNLGSDRQAASVTDATEAAAGWYWQFNRAQGYKHDGTNRTPGPAWIAFINESSDWTAVNDPCSLLLGGGWRLPTRTEWTAADGAPQSWLSNADAYSSVLKLHNAGSLGYNTGTLGGRGNSGMYWSSTGSNDSTNYSFAVALSITSGSSVMSYNSSIYKANGYSVRCLE